MAKTSAKSTGVPLDRVARDLGKLVAQLYVGTGTVLQSTKARQRALNRRGMAVVNSVRPAARAALLERSSALVLEGFRSALTGELREQALRGLGLTARALEHVEKDTPGNPDARPGVGGVVLNGTALVGPTITIRDRQTRLTIGVGPEIDYRGVKTGILGGEDVRDVAGKSVKGAGIWIGIEIRC